MTMTGAKMKRKGKGQSLFEVVISLAIMTTVLVAIVILSSNAVRNSTFSKNKTLATRYSQEATEWLRGQRDENWSAFYNRALVSGTYCMDSLDWSSIGACGSSDYVSDTILVRETSLTIVDPDRVDVTVSINWEDPQGIHVVNSATTYTDWRAN